MAKCPPPSKGWAAVPILLALILLCFLPRLIRDRVRAYQQLSEQGRVRFFEGSENAHNWTMTGIFLLYAFGFAYLAKFTFDDIDRRQKKCDKEGYCSSCSPSQRWADAAHDEAIEEEEEEEDSDPGIY